MSGTASEKSAKDHKSPLVRNSRNWTKAAPAATSAANTMRPARESGVVRGSEIMKKAKSRSAPFSSRWRGITAGWPSHSA